MQTGQRFGDIRPGEIILEEILYILILGLKGFGLFLLFYFSINLSIIFLFWTSEFQKDSKLPMRIIYSFFHGLLFGALFNIVICGLDEKYRNAEHFAIAIFAGFFLSFFSKRLSSTIRDATILK